MSFKSLVLFLFLFTNEYSRGTLSFSFSLASQCATYLYFYLLVAHCLHWSYLLGYISFGSRETSFSLASPKIGKVEEEMERR